MSEKTKAAIKEKFANEEYPIHVIGRHIEITDSMKAYAVDKLKKKIDRFEAHILDITITMDIQKLQHNVNFIVDINNTKIKVSGHSDNMYASIDLAIAHLEAKLRRYLSKLHEHHSKTHHPVEMNVHVVARIIPIDDINDQIEEANLERVEKDLRPHKIVSRETKPLKTLTQEEAIMKMELSENAFMIYKAEEDQQLKVIYLRTDGNYGIIEAKA